MKLAAVLLVLVFVARTEGLWANRKVNCGVSVWADWDPWSAPAPGGSRSRSRTVIRQPQHGGIPCPSLAESQDRQDPWNQSKVAQKFRNNFVSGHTTYYKFVQQSARVGNIGQQKAAGGGDGGLTLLPRDLLFLIDMSGSISRNDWTSTKQTLVRLIKKLCGTIGKDNANNRIAIITFSYKVVLNFDFKTHWTIDSVSDAIMNMPQAKGSTCTGDAFAYAHKYMFQPNTGIRSATESVKEVLVLTDGESNCGATLAVKVKELQVKAFVFALAIGNFNIPKRIAEIESMVSRPLIDHIFSLANFLEFQKMVDFIYSYAGFAKCAPLELK